MSISLSALMKQFHHKSHHLIFLNGAGPILVKFLENIVKRKLLLNGVFTELTERVLNKGLSLLLIQLSGFVCIILLPNLVYDG